MKEKIRMKIIDNNLLDGLSEKASENPRLRINYNFHESLEDPVNRLLNAMQPGTYVRPHRHINPDKTEIFLIVRGKILMIIFDDDGRVISTHLMSPELGIYGMEIEAGTWHSLIVLEENTVIYEIKNGPFIPLSAENLAPWAPDAENKEEATKYLRDILDKNLK